MAPMPPSFGEPNYDFLQTPDSQRPYEEVSDDGSLSEMAFWYLVLLLSMVLTWVLLYFCLRIMSLRQKTRTQASRRMYGGSQNRPSSLPSEPTIFVSPTNMPPPPKYEAMMAPPSYEEVVGIHYPNYQVTRVTQIQPITHPIAAALAGTNVIENANNAVNNANNAVNNANNAINNANNVVNSTSNVSNNVVSNTRTENAIPTVVTVTDERRSSVSVATTSS